MSRLLAVLFLNLVLTLSAVASMEPEPVCRAALQKALKHDPQRLQAYETCKELEEQDGRTSLKSLHLRIQGSGGKYYTLNFKLMCQELQMLGVTEIAKLTSGGGFVDSFSGENPAQLKAVSLQTQRLDEMSSEKEGSLGLLISDNAHEGGEETYYLINIMWTERYENEPFLGFEAELTPMRLDETAGELVPVKDLETQRPIEPRTLDIDLNKSWAKLGKQKLKLGRSILRGTEGEYIDKTSRKLAKELAGKGGHFGNSTYSLMTEREEQDDGTYILGHVDAYYARANQGRVWGYFSFVMKEALGNRTEIISEEWHPNALTIKNPREFAEKRASELAEEWSDMEPYSVEGCNDSKTAENELTITCNITTTKLIFGGEPHTSTAPYDFKFRIQDGKYYLLSEPTR